MAIWKYGTASPTVGLPVGFRQLSEMEPDWKPIVPIILRDQAVVRRHYTPTAATFHSVTRCDIEEWPLVVNNKYFYGTVRSDSLVKFVPAPFLEVFAPS
jgi:hypothetical protein